MASFSHGYRWSYLRSGLCVCTASTLSTWAISPDPHILISKLFMHPKSKNLKNSLLILFKMPSFHCEDETIRYLKLQLFTKKWGGQRGGAPLWVMAVNLDCRLDRMKRVPAACNESCLVVLCLVLSPFLDNQLHCASTSDDVGDRNCIFFALWKTWQRIKENEHLHWSSDSEAMMCRA